MTYTFDQKKLLSNISTLIQQRGYKVGELETSISVSQGYLSRLARGESTPSMEIIYKIAKLLDVNIERLIEGDFDRNATNIAYLQKFIHRVFDRTLSGELEWKSVSIIDINFSLLGRSELLPNVCCSDERTDFSPYEMDFQRMGYVGGSMFGYENRSLFSFTCPHSMVKAADSFFYADIKPSKRLYLFKYAIMMYEECSEIEYEEGLQEGEPTEWYELVLRIGDDMKNSYEPVANTLYKCSPLQKDVEALYEELKYHEDDLHISKKVRSTIDDFMDESFDQ